MLKLVTIVVLAKDRISECLADRKGVTSMEYGLIAAATVTVVGAAMSVVSSDLNTIWTSIKTTLTTASG
jgi:Flp pilus assembly pilin Flp